MSYIIVEGEVTKVAQSQSNELAYELIVNQLNKTVIDFDFKPSNKGTKVNYNSSANYKGLFKLTKNGK